MNGTFRIGVYWSASKQGRTNCALAIACAFRPRARADIIDIALTGKVATIETIEQDFDDRVYVRLRSKMIRGAIWARHG